jgi:hypothetical protein
MPMVVWISLCLALASDPNLPRMQETALRTMARTFSASKSLACSTLHGLGHWQRDHERQVTAIIDGLLDAPRLISYAHSARCGWDVPRPTTLIISSVGVRNPCLQYAANEHSRLAAVSDVWYSVNSAPA